MNRVNTNALAVPLPSVLLKAAMAVSGVVMAGWLTLHMVGNLLVFTGPTLMNMYGAKLHATGLLWPMRLLLLASLAIHVACAALTTARGRAARPARYRRPLNTAASTPASRSMRVTGTLLLAYIVYHVATIYGVGHPSFVTGDVHHNLTALLRLPVHALAYVLATAWTALHLAHGLSSAWISLGWMSLNREKAVQRAMIVWAALITIGFAAPAFAVSLGWL